MKYFNGIIISLLCLATACQKKDDTMPDISKLKIQFSSPSGNAVFHKGDTVFIKAAVSYITEMHGYTLRIEDTVSGTEYYSMEDHVHGDNFSVSEYWVDTLTTAAVLRLRLTVVLDHDGSSEYRDVMINTKP